MKKFKVSLLSLLLFSAILFNFISVFGLPAVTASAYNSLSTETKNSFILSENKLPLNEQSAKPEFENKVISSLEKLYNLDGSADFIYVEFENGGYAVYAQQTMELLEYSLQDKIPFQSQQTKYYAGPTNYLHKENENFINITSGENIELSKSEIVEYSRQARAVLIDKKVNQLQLETYSTVESNSIIERTYSNKKDKPKLDSNNLIVPTQGSGKLISNAQYFLSNPTHGKNLSGHVYGNGNSGTCGPVAAQLLLGYNNYYNHRRIIPDRFLNGYSDTSNSVVFSERNPNYCVDPMSMTRWTAGTRSEDTGANSFYSKL